MIRGFSYDIDFQRDMRSGDSFEVAFEGQTLRHAALTLGEFTNFDTMADRLQQQTLVGFPGNDRRAGIATLKSCGAGIQTQSAFCLIAGMTLVAAFDQ